MPIKQLDYTIHLCAPVLISSAAGDENIIMSEGYLPGSVLLGMFANHYLQRQKPATPAHQDPRFKSWFLSTDLQFLAGYKINGSGQRSLPIPLSLHFLKSDDVTLRDLLFEEEETPAATAMPRRRKEDAKHQDGFGLLQNGQFEKVAVATGLTLHHQRTNPLRGRSAESEIFNYEALQPQQTFAAAIIGEEKILQAFSAWIGAKKFAGRLGRSKNTEYGAVAIDFGAGVLRPVNETLEPEGIQLDAEEPGFTLTFLSHVLLCNQHGQFAVDAALLQNYLLTELRRAGLTVLPEQLYVEKSHVRAVTIENYVSVWRARRPAALAFQMGSCFACRYDPALGAAGLQKLAALLERLQQQGLGNRRQEGFGRVAVAWQKPGELRNVTRQREREQRERWRLKPATELPALGKQIFHATLRAHFEERTRALASRRVEAFTALPSGALISRLQRFIENAGEPAAFRRMLAVLRETARSQLERCHARDRSMTLLEFLESFGAAGQPSELDKLLASLSPEETTLCESIAVQPAADAELKRQLFKIYFTTFFALMRKGQRA